MKVVSIPFKSGLTVIDMAVSDSPEVLASLNPLQIGSDCNAKFAEKEEGKSLVSIPFKSGLTVIRGEESHSG